MWALLLTSGICNAGGKRQQEVSALPLCCWRVASALISLGSTTSPSQSAAAADSAQASAGGWSSKQHVLRERSCVRIRWVGQSSRPRIRCADPPFVHIGHSAAATSIHRCLKVSLYLNIVSSATAAGDLQPGRRMCCCPCGQCSSASKHDHQSWQRQQSCRISSSSCSSGNSQ